MKVGEAKEAEQTPSSRRSFKELGAGPQLFVIKVPFGNVLCNNVLRCAVLFMCLLRNGINFWGKASERVACAVCACGRCGRAATRRG